MSASKSVLELIGNTPMVEFTRLDTGPCRLFAKLENQNPGGSIKDRIGLSMIEAAEADGSLSPGGVLVEATAGNTGLGLALVAAQKGYRLIIVMPDKMSQEKVFHLKALGAEVRMTRSDVAKGHPEHYQDLAQAIADETGAFYVNQFANPANPLAHETTTAPEIWEQMDHDLDAVVCGVGSGGTLTGIGRFMKTHAPHVEMVLADPEGSILAETVATGVAPSAVGSWLVEGIGEDFIPLNCDLSLVSAAFTIPDAEAFATAREVLLKEGFIVGSSSGTLIAAALRYCRAQSTPKRVVTFVPDSGNKYLSKMYNDFWMLDKGLIERSSYGDIRDLIARRHTDNEDFTLKADDSLLTAYSRMKLYDVSQLVVIRDGQVVGILDESDVLLAVYKHEERFDDPVSKFMTAKLETVSPSAPLKSLLAIFAQDRVAIVNDGEQYLGLITRIDMLNHLRRQME
jgi:cystathionine beta-synthase